MRERKNNGGFTLLEVVIGLALTAVMIMAVAFTAERTNDSYEVARDQQVLRADAQRMLAMIEANFADANGNTMAPQGVAFSPDLTFEVPVGSNAGAGTLWDAEARRLELELESGEIANGLDDNGNGLIDECAVVLTQDPGGVAERSFVIGHGVRSLHAGEVPNGLDDNGNGFVDEPGLCFELAGDLLTIRLTLERIGRDGDTILAASETAVRLRNTN